MPDPVTILATLAYAIAKTGKGPAAERLAQFFGGEASRFLHADLVKLREAFLDAARPESGREPDRAAARSSVHASLFCLMEALGEGMEPASGTLPKWKQCLVDRLPQTLRELGRVPGGFLAEGDRSRLLEAKKDCEGQLERIETCFEPLDVQPNQMLLTIDKDYAGQRGEEALEALEEKHGRFPDYARQIFYERWFGYLCGSFQHEIGHNQPAANVLLNISMARLDEKIDQGFREMRRLIPGGARLTRLEPFASVPPLPPAFMDRPDLAEPLIDKLLSGPGTVSITAIEGMGGVGKTMVALGLCHDPRVRQAFPDGIVWVTIGRESRISPEERMKQVAQALNQEFQVYSQTTYRSLLGNKAALVVLDDVWKLEDVEPFRLDPGRSCLLYTSRDKRLAGPLGADSQEVGVLDDAQARRFLGRWAGHEKMPLPEPEASGILNECKGLALGLGMVGGALKGQPDSEWSRLVADLRKARLKEVGTRPGGYAYETLHASIAVGVNALDATAKARYLCLAVLLEDMAAPEVMLRALWGEEPDVHRTARLLVDRSLARRDAEGNIRLHDFQLDYVRGEHPDPEALDLQHATLVRSSHVVRPHPEQFASQMTGRLLAYGSQPGIAAFLKEIGACAPRPWLRPLRPALEPAGGPARRVLEGHTDWVTAVALSANGKRAVSGSEDRTLRVWDLDSNQPPRVLERHTDVVTAVALSVDGKRAVSGSYDKTLRVWDLDGNQPPRVLEGHADVVTAVALSADGKRAVSGSDDRTLRVWDLEVNRPPCVLEGHTGRVKAVALSADGRRAISGSDDNTLRVWDLEGNRPPRVLEGHTAWVWAVALSADGKRAISGSGDNPLRVWDLEGDRPPRILEDHKGWVTAVALAADGKGAVSGSVDGTLRVWDLESSQPPRVLEGHTDKVWAVALATDGMRAVSGSWDHTLRVWDLEGNQPPRVLAGHTDAVWAVALATDGRRAVSGSVDKTLRVWDLGGNQPPRVLEGHTAGVLAVALSADGKRAVSGSWDHTLRVWDLEGHQPPRVLEGHTGWALAVALAADGRHAVSGSGDKTLRVWDLESKQPPRLLEGHTGEVTAVALSADGKRTVSGSHDKTLRVWGLEGHQPPRLLEGHTGVVWAVALAADGRRAVSGSGDTTLRVWDLEGSQPPRVLEGHKGWVTAVALSADGRRAVSGSEDRTLRVWDLEGGRCLAAFACDAPVEACAWAQGLIAAGDRGGRVHFLAWEE